MASILTIGGLTWGEQPKADEVIVRVERWYDRTSRCWIIQGLNAAGDQVGDAGVEPRRIDAECVERDMLKAAGL